jgi:hypothetical protein
MFEIGIFCVILLAVSYWAVLWLMGRREDVLHGEFVEAGTAAEEPLQSVFPDRPAIQDRVVARATVPKPPLPTAIPEQSVLATIPEQPAFRPERLESLLNSIKQDLNQLVRK